MDHDDDDVKTEAGNPSHKSSETLGDFPLLASPLPFDTLRFECPKSKIN